MIAFDYPYVDEHGVRHFYPWLFSWWCSVHERVCNPYTPVTVAELVDRAGMDPAVSDEMWVPLRQALEDRPIDLGGGT